MLESVQKFEEQKILFNAKKVVEEEILERKGKEERVPEELRKGIDRKDEEIRALREEIEKLSFGISKVQ